MKTFSHHQPKRRKTTTVAEKSRHQNTHPRNHRNGIQGRHASLHIRAQRAIGLGFLAGGGLGFCLFDRCCVRRSTGSHCAPDDNREESAEEEIGALRVLRRNFQKHRGV
jgi:hypothetical protein